MAHPQPAANALASFFAQPDDELLVRGVSESIGLAFRRDGAHLLHAASVIGLSNDIEAKVSNGGFHYFFQFAEHRARETLAALRELGATAAVAALEGALSVFPAGWPQQDKSERMTFLNGLADRMRDVFEGGCAALYHHECGLDALRARYARGHAGELIGLPDPVDCLLPLPAPASDADARTVSRWLVSRKASVELDGRDLWRGPYSNGTALPATAFALQGVEFDAACSEAVAMFAHLTRCNVGRQVSRLQFDGCAWDADFAWLSSMPRLRALTVRGARAVSSAALVGFASAALSTLWLGVPGVDAAQIAVLARSRTIEELGLRGASIDAAAALALASMPQLAKLTCLRCVIADTALTRLRDRPNLELLVRD